MSQTSSVEAARPPAEAKVFQEGFLQALCTISFYTQSICNILICSECAGVLMSEPGGHAATPQTQASQHTQAPLAQWWLFFSGVKFGLETFHIVPEQISSFRLS